MSVTPCDTGSGHTNPSDAAANSCHQALFWAQYIAPRTRWESLQRSPDLKLDLGRAVSRWDGRKANEEERKGKGKEDGWRRAGGRGR